MGSAARKSRPSADPGGARPAVKVERRASRQFSMRIPSPVLQELEEYVKRTGLSTSAAIAQGMKEWLRMQRHPGIDFRWTPAGRKAHVTGTGLTVWELHNMWLDHREDVEKIRANYPDLSLAQVLGAVQYAQEYPDEAPAGWGEPPKWVRAVRV